METIRIFLVEDHDMVRDGLKALLTSIPDIAIIGEASTGRSLFEKLKIVQPDIIVLDISLPDISGIEITKRLRHEYPQIRVLILSMYTHEDFVTGAIKSGAKGYLPKNTSRDELVKAIYAIFRGEEFFGETISKILLKSFIRSAVEKEDEQEKPAYNLSSRELEILKLYAEGFNNKEIGVKLNISVRTVETHKNHIMKKLGIRSPVEMVKFAIRNKIINL
ncbi:MAG: response regulator transcription factor [Bacteroidetes bacterium]|nr:response regulator transcription factor [Bacteroidota bacterium]